MDGADGERHHERETRKTDYRQFPRSAFSIVLVSITQLNLGQCRPTSYSVNLTVTILSSRLVYVRTSLNLSSLPSPWRCTELFRGHLRVWLFDIE